MMQLLKRQGTERFRTEILLYMNSGIERSVNHHKMIMEINS